MLTRRAFVAGALLLPACSTSGGGKDRAPSSKFALNKWRIQLPVNDSGNPSGDMAIVSPAKTVKPWFIASQDRLEFICPAKGATSPNSPNPRTELAEGNEWRIERGGVMEASLAVTAIPSGKMIVAQVWNRHQALRLSVARDGTISTSSEYQPVKVVGKVAIGQPFTYRIEVADEILTLFINGRQVQQYGVHEWAGQQMYFKAGAYCGAAPGTDPKALFKAAFTELRIAHP